MSSTITEGPPSLEQISVALRERIESFDFSLRPVAIGTVTEVGDGIVRIAHDSLGHVPANLHVADRAIGLDIAVKL